MTLDYTDEAIPANDGRAKPWNGGGPAPANESAAETETEADTDLDAAASVGGLFERIKADPDRVAFDVATIAAAAELHDSDQGEYHALVRRLKGLHISIKDWKKAVNGVVARRNAQRRIVDITEWQGELIRSGSGAPKAATANVVTMLTRAEEWRGLLRYNEFTGAIETTRPPPWSDETVPAGEWTEADDIRLVVALERELGTTMQPGAVRAAVGNVARRVSYHPVREELRAIVWDQKPRLDTWLRDYMGAGKADKDGEEQPARYLARVGRWFLISAVARVMRPGCQVDHMLVFEGEQGARKTSAAIVLAGDDSRRRGR